MCKKEVWGQNVLDFVECNDVHGLDVVFEANNLLFEIIHHNLVIFNDTSNLEFLDAITEKIFNSGFLFSLLGMLRRVGLKRYKNQKIYDSSST